MSESAHSLIGRIPKYLLLSPASISGAGFIGTFLAVALRRRISADNSDNSRPSPTDDGHTVTGKIGSTGHQLFAEFSSPFTADSLQLSVAYVRALGGLVAEWFGCLTQAQKGPGSNRSRDAVG